MTLPWQLEWPTFLEAVLFPLAVGYVLTLSSWFFRRAQQLVSLRAQARDELVASLLRADDTAFGRALTRLPREDRFLILVPLAISLAGEERARLAALAQKMGMLGRARQMVSSRNWSQRLTGARILSLLGDQDAPMEALLDDPEPLVVAEAAYWAAEHPTPARIARLVALLRQPQRIGPFALKDALQRLGHAAEAALLKVAEDLPPPQLLDVLHVARVNGYLSFAGPAREWLKAEEPVVRARACDLLGELGGEGTPEALLQALQDEHPEPPARAAVALGRLGFTPAGASLARLAGGEESWEVRWSAGLGLRLMGAEGNLYLHQLQPPALGRLLLATPESQIGRWGRD